MIAQQLGLLRPLALYGESSHSFYYAVLPVGTRSMTAGAHDVLLQRGNALLLPRNMLHPMRSTFPAR